MPTDLLEWGGGGDNGGGQGGDVEQEEEDLDIIDSLIQW